MKATAEERGEGGIDTGLAGVQVRNTCVVSPTKKKPILGTNPRLEAPLPLYFSRTSSRISLHIYEIP